MKSKAYPSKLLLFGEYTIIDGGAALSLPFSQFEGFWTKNEEGLNLNPFLGFLKDQSGFDQNQLNLAISESWKFKSNIPLGYGLGSSGALTAAAYDQFALNHERNFLKLKSILAEMESFFHGKSSGLDPLTSYLNNAVLVYNSKVSVIKEKLLEAPFFLLDSKMTRESKPLINHFKTEKENNQKFNSALKELNRQNDLAISSMLCGNLLGLEWAMEKISTIQYEYFQKMIPAHIGAIWEKGLEDKEYFMKLSGAGGGGFFLGYAIEPKSRLLESENVIQL